MTRTVNNGATVIDPGDPAGAIYLVRRGKAAVCELREGRDEQVHVFGAGLLFAEADVLKGLPHGARLTAIGELVVDVFDGARFREALGRDPELHAQVQALRRVRALRPDLPSIQSLSKLEGHPAIEIRFTRDADQPVIRYRPDAELWSADRPSSAQPREHLTWNDRDRGLYRELALQADRVVHVRAEGPWRELRVALDHLLERAPLTPAARERFARGGELLGDPPEGVPAEPQAIVCHCLQLSLASLQDAARHAPTLEALRERTGATTVCGGCTNQVAELVGGALGEPVRLVAERELLPGVRSFRFAALSGEPLPGARAGQHVVLAARIDDRWVHRAYTLTSPAGETAHREIVVKRERFGRFTTWLFDRRPASPELRLTEPQGTFTPDLTGSDPIVCVVGGIGVTPALSIARSLAAAGAGPRLHLEYSATTEGGFVCREELAALAAAHPNITVRFRVTGRGDVLGDEAIAALARELPGARWYICGRGSFIAGIRAALSAIGVPDARIHVEQFVTAARSTAAAPPRTWMDQIVFGVGVALLVAYLSMALDGTRIPELEALQHDETYKRWTGLLLAAFIASQWLLPAMRFVGRLRAAAALHRWHRGLGALAPLFLWVHARRPGFAYLGVLSGVYLANVAVGLADKSLIVDPERRERYFRVWLAPHVVLACVTVALLLVHVYMVFAYQGAGT